MVRVGEPDGRVDVVGPALEERLVRRARGGRVGTLERRDGGEPARFVRRGGNPVRRQRHHRPVAAPHPHELVDGEGHHLPPALARAQVELPPVVVVADRHGVMPAFLQAQVLQHDDRVARRDLRQKVGKARRELIRHEAVAASGGEHLDLEAPFALREVDLGHERVGRDLDALGREHGGERRRSALIFALREERHVRELDLAVQLRRQRLAQRRRLRQQARAAAKRGQNENARYRAGVSIEAAKRA